MAGILRPVEETGQRRGVPPNGTSGLPPCPRLPDLCREPMRRHRNQYGGSRVGRNLVRMTAEWLRRATLTTVSLVAVGLAACGTNPPPDGAVTGVASPCVGLPTAHYLPPVTVYLTRGSRTVDRQTVKGRYVYRFVVPPGDYVVATHEGTSSKPVAVSVHSGQTTKANILSYC